MCLIEYLTDSWPIVKTEFCVAEFCFRQRPCYRSGIVCGSAWAARAGLATLGASSFNSAKQPFGGEFHLGHSGITK